MGKFNASQFRKAIDQTIRGSKPFAYERARERFEENRILMLEEFNNHEVTKEIEAGPEAENSSGTLGGKGNLFSFIGFKHSSRPIEEVREQLDKQTRLFKTPTVTRNGNQVTITHAANVPTIDDIDAPLPWESGRSWVKGIEQGISGFGHYIYWKFIKGSRSGTGAQADNTLRTGKFNNTSYFSRILKNFRNRFRRR